MHKVQIDYTNPGNYIVPFWYLCPDTSEKISQILPCWNIDNWMNFMTINTLSLIVFITGESVAISVILFFVYFQHYVKEHEKVMLQKLEVMSHKMKAFDCYQCEWELRRDFKRIIKYCQLLNSSMIEVLPFLNAVASNFLIAVFLMSPAAIYSLLYEDLTLASAFIGFMCSAYFAALLIQFFYVCYCAGKIKDMNEIIAIGVYDLPWYNSSPGFRKFLRLFLTVSQKPIQITCYGVFEPNFNLFAKVLRMVYTTLYFVLVVVAHK